MKKYTFKFTGNALHFVLANAVGIPLTFASFGVAGLFLVYWNLVFVINGIEIQCEE
jgi:hypothetical protein